MNSQSVFTSAVDTFSFKSTSKLNCNPFSLLKSMIPSKFLDDVAGVRFDREEVYFSLQVLSALEEVEDFDSLPEYNTVEELFDELDS